VNDAAMQALGSYDGGKMLFLGLGTGLGSAFAMNGLVAPMELGHLPYRRGTYESYVGKAGMRERGTKKWQEHVETVVAILSAGLHPDYVVLGGGNAGKLRTLPAGSRLGTNAHAFEGGFRLWAEDSPGRIEA
jgi:polyphosphate glucokinase